MQRYKPPSRVRYEKKHPTLSFRLDLKTKKRLKKMLGKRSVADFVKEAMGVREREKESLENKYDEGYKKGYNDGYHYGVRLYGAYTHCGICGDKLYLGGEENKRAIDKFFRIRGTYHKKCREEREKRRREGR